MRLLILTTLLSHHLPFVNGSLGSSISHLTSELLQHPEPASTDLPSSINQLEQEFLTHPSSDSASSHLKYITSEAHVAGTQGDEKMAGYVRDQFTAYGIPMVEIDHLKTLLNYPMEKPIVQLLEKNDANEALTIIYEAELSEDVEAADDTSDTPWRNETFLGYAPSGDVTAEFVYANYGRPSDFDILQARGISVENKIVIVRYGQCFRGLKVMNAQRLGAVGVIIYSDPMDDGYSVGEVYPDGPWRSESSMQRGSVIFLSLCAGDPSRADPRYEDGEDGGVSAVQRICGYKQEELIPSIPAVPMSYGDVTPLLRSLNDDLSTSPPPSFVGHLVGISYNIGPSNHQLRIVTNHTFTETDIPNVIGIIPSQYYGTELDQPIILGNHRDAWVYGAADPNSGTAAMLEVAKGLGALSKTGWVPQRSIYFCSWSGEEYGLIGSTGWAELNAELVNRAVAYLNVDTAVAGDELEVSASPVLATLFTDVMEALNTNAVLSKKGEDMHTPFTLLDANTNRAMFSKPQDIGTLGSGSDYTVFLDRFGVSSLDFAFRTSQGGYGVYHSIYDSYHWMEEYGGSMGVPGSAFEIMADAAKIWGVLALRLSESEVLPLDHVAASKSVAGYIDQIKLSYKDAPLHLDTLVDAVGFYEKSSLEFHNMLLNTELSDGVQLHDLNKKLAQTERKFLSDDGLPKRPYFRHVLQAPGMYLGYVSEVFPGVSQACDDGDYGTANQQILVAAQCVTDAALYLSSAVAA